MNAHYFHLSFLQNVDKVQMLCEVACTSEHHICDLVLNDNHLDFGIDLFLHGVRCQGDCGKNLVSSLPDEKTEVRVTSRKGAYVCIGSKNQTCCYAMCSGCFSSKHKKRKLLEVAAGGTASTARRSSSRSSTGKAGKTQKSQI